MAFILKPEFADKVERINYVNKRIIMVTIKLAGSEMSAQHQERPQEENEHFYQKLQDTIDTVHDGDKVIVGYLNAHVWIARNGLENAIGAFAIGEKNEEGEQLTDFCVSKTG